MSGGIFVLDGAELVAMHEQPYDSEDLLQALLADYPDLLAGGDDVGGSARRWLLVKREVGIPDTETGGSRWSLDHLFLDQEAVPTLVEVKRSEDTRIRREVVGQMLDYAANGVVYWPAERLRSDFESRCAKNGQEPEDVFRAGLGDELDPERFWDDVEQNLRSGRVRLIFVSDRIPSELRRVIEFLNERMKSAIAERDLLWQPKLKSAYLGFYRPGMYYCCGITVKKAQPAEFWVKLPLGPEELRARRGCPRPLSRAPAPLGCQQ